MDGYAVRAEDIAGATDGPGDPAGGSRTSPPAAPSHLTAAAGTAHRIMTGAHVPDGADAVVQVEKTDGGPRACGSTRRRQRGGDPVRRLRHPPGELALGAGRVRHAPQLGLAGSAGTLADPGLRPAAGTGPLHRAASWSRPAPRCDSGQIYESNGAMLTAAATEAGAFAEQVHFVPDSVDEFRARLDEYVDREQGADLIITSGGVSAGAYEVVKDAFTGHGVEFTKVAMQPGMPQGCGHYTSAAGTAVADRHLAR